MIKVKIISPGLTKEEAYKELQEKFLTMLSPYAQINWVTTKDFHRQKSQSLASTQILEGEEIIKALGEKNGEVWILDERGKQVTSPRLAQRIQKLEDDGINITIIIGGTFGLSEAVKSKADYLWSLSDLTLTHEMARCIVLEQLYRAITINKGKNYHY